MKYFNLNIIILAFLSLLFFFPKPSHQQPYTSSPIPIPNPRLLNAYFALQAWKHAITSDPQGFTSNWYGPNVCSYNGIYCAFAPDDPHNTTTVVAGIDLNHANIAGSLPEELGLLTDLALFHVNSNQFCGTLPKSFVHLYRLFELDISNNLFFGEFPHVVLNLPSLKFLDIRFNNFQGSIPPALFDLTLDALFINNNNFQSTFPSNIGNSPVSVLVFANNNFKGCLPGSIGNMAKTLNEIILANVGLGACLPKELGLLNQVTVLDVSFNGLVGILPESIGKMTSLEELNVAHNELSGEIPASICVLPRLQNFTYSDNYFCGEPSSCLSLPAEDDKKNCIPGRPEQRSAGECQAFYSRPPPDCSAFGCQPKISPPASPPYHYL